MRLAGKYRNELSNYEQPDLDGLLDTIFNLSLQETRRDAGHAS